MAGFAGKSITLQQLNKAYKMSSKMKNALLRYRNDDEMLWQKL